MKIAFIGLGIMGQTMAKNLLKAGHQLFVYDRNAATLGEMQAFGATVCESSAETVKDVDPVITMLPNSPHAKSVMLENDRLAEIMPKTATFIDCSMMMDQNFKPGFRIDLRTKDLNNVVDAVRAVDAPIPLTQQVLEMMKLPHRDGVCDHSALLKYCQKPTGEILHH